MIKGIILMIVIAALAYFGLDFLGYKVAPQNFQYYVPKQAEQGSEKNMLMQYFDMVKSENQTHPLLIRKNGVSGAGALDQSSTKLLKDLLQVDKFSQMEKVKKQIKEISAKADERNKTIEEAAKI